jgi:uncharacterized membrane protein
MKKNFYWMMLGIVAAAGALLRFTPALFQRDYWYDEAFTGILLKAPWGEMNQMIFDDVHPPLYYWLAKLWAAPFLYSPAGIRSFSLVLGVAIVFSIFWIGMKMFNKKAGLLAAVFVAFSPFAIEYSQEARMYSLFGLLMLWSVWFFYQALKTNNLRNWIIWGLLSGLAFYTHYLSLFFFLMFYAAFVYYRIADKKINLNTKTDEKLGILHKMREVLIGGKGFWIGTGIIFVFFASWIKIFIGHISKGNLGWINPSQLSDIPKTLQIFFFGHPAGTGGVPWSNEFRFFFDGTSAGLMIFTLFLVTGTLAWVRKIKWREFSILAIISFGTLLLLILLSHGIDLEINGAVKNISVKLYVARYFMPAALLVYLLLAGLVVSVFKSKYAWVIVMAIYAVLLMNLKPLTYSSSWSVLYYNQDDLLGKEDVLVAVNPFDYTTARYYFGEDRVRYYNKSNPTEDFSGWVVVGNKNKITELKDIAQNKKMVVLDSQCDLKGLSLAEGLQITDKLSVCRYAE